MDSWLLRHRVQGETDSEPEGSGFPDEDVATSVSARSSAFSSPGPSASQARSSAFSSPGPSTSQGQGLRPTVRRSARVAAAASRAAPVLLSPASSVHFSLGESDDKVDQEEWDHTREEYHSDSDGTCFGSMNHGLFDYLGSWDIIFL